MDSVSVIIPVYNVRDYLEECIKSVVNQSYKNLEIILIDDGSTDGSTELCQLYESKYKHVKVIHQRNGGLSRARNTGLDNAIGEYVMFIDSDDYIANNVIGELVDIFKSEDCDLIYATYTGFTDNEYSEFISNIKSREIRVNNNDIANLDKEEVIALLLKEKSYYCTANTKVYKRSFIEENNLRFKCDIYHEDEEWTPRVLLNSKKIYIYNKQFYMRRYRENSIMTTKDNRKLLKRVEDNLNIANSMIDYIESNCKDKNLKNIYKEYFGSFIVTCLILCKQIDDKDIKFVCKDLIKKNIDLLRFTTKIQYKLIYNVFRLFNIDVTMRVVGILIKIRNRK